jgi:hypothetical protein
VRSTLDALEAGARGSVAFLSELAGDARMPAFVRDSCAATLDAMELGEPGSRVYLRALADDDRIQRCVRDVCEASLDARRFGEPGSDGYRNAMADDDRNAGFVRDACAARRDAQRIAPWGTPEYIAVLRQDPRLPAVALANINSAEGARKDSTNTMDRLFLQRMMPYHGTVTTLKNQDEHIASADTANFAADFAISPERVKPGRDLVEQLDGYFPGGTRTTDHHHSPSNSIINRALSYAPRVGAMGQFWTTRFAGQDGKKRRLFLWIAQPIG